MILLTSITIRISEEEKDALLKYAQEQDLNMTQVVRRAIRAFLSPKEDKKVQE